MATLKRDKSKVGKLSLVSWWRPEHTLSKRWEQTNWLFPDPTVFPRRDYECCIPEIINKKTTKKFIFLKYIFLTVFRAMLCYTIANLQQCKILHLWMKLQNYIGIEFRFFVNATWPSLIGQLQILRGATWRPSRVNFSLTTTHNKTKWIHFLMGGGMEDDSTFEDKLLKYFLVFLWTRWFFEKTKGKLPLVLQGELPLSGVSIPRGPCFI